ncbi:MAG: DNA translocase FtsK 4TM domain-containing protein, partial [Tepidisphaeraceae bacterium]
MERAQIIRQSLLALGIGVWAFLLLSLGSFHATDWPSHSVYPYPETRNLCGDAGAYVAYYAFLLLGQGVFPLLFFSGVCVALIMFKNRVGDLWLRAAGLALLAVAFAAMIHNLRPGSLSSFPEGHGGIVGIGASAFLQSHFNTIGTRLILLTALLIGLLLVADDLVLRTPRLVGAALANVKQHAPQVRFRFPPLPRLPSLPRFVTRDAVKAVEPDESDDSPVRLEMPKKKRAKPASEGEPEVEEAAPEPAKPPAPPPVVRKDIIVKLPNTAKPRQVAPVQPPKELGEYHLPNWELLDNAEHGFAASQEKVVREKAAILEQALREFDIEAHVVEIDTGPVITMYELGLAPGVKVGAITALSNDIMRALKAESVRIVAPVPGKSTVGIEVPNAEKEKVRLKELMQLAPEATQKMSIPLFLGKDASGEPLITDLAVMPHLLIAGTTGSGKSVCINTIIMSMMYSQRPDVVKLILIDPK